jgi:hypothetical protein
MAKHPLAEVFGFPVDNHSSEAERHRRLRLCPYHNRVANCTKDKANDPLGVCSIFDADSVAITCPVRFRQDWRIAEDAAQFFFPPGARWTTLSEVRLQDADSQAAGNIDHVIVAYDDRGKVIDFGALEVQAVYVSGNIRRPFEHYLQDPTGRSTMDWSRERNYPRPDYLSSSRKRLAPQLLFKGGILHAWGKKQAVAVHHDFYKTLPLLKPVNEAEADLMWLVYDLALEPSTNRFQLQLTGRVATRYEESLESISRPKIGSLTTFMGQLQDKLDEKFDDEANPPDAPLLSDLL